MRYRWGWAFAAIAAGCGGGTSVSGTVDGVSLNVKDSVSWQGSTIAGSDGGAAWAVVITNIPGTCAVLSSPKNPPNTQLLLLLVEAAGPVTPGTYQVALGGVAAAGGGFITTDAQCHSGVSESATSGSITISTATSTEATGEFILNFGSAGSAGTMRGSFSAPFCAAFSNVFSGGGGDGGVATCG
jgi:hypothetical protein